MYWIVLSKPKVNDSPIPKETVSNSPLLTSNKPAPILPFLLGVTVNRVSPDFLETKISTGCSLFELTTLINCCTDDIS